MAVRCEQTQDFTGRIPPAILCAEEFDVETRGIREAFDLAGGVLAIVAIGWCTTGFEFSVDVRAFAAEGVFDGVAACEVGSGQEKKAVGLENTIDFSDDTHWIGVEVFEHFATENGVEGFVFVGPRGKLDVEIVDDKGEGVTAGCRGNAACGARFAAPEVVAADLGEAFVAKQGGREVMERSTEFEDAHAGFRVGKKRQCFEVAAEVRFEIRDFVGIVGDEAAQIGFEIVLRGAVV